MDLSHIPMRGFPLPNPLVAPLARLEAAGRWLSLTALASSTVFGLLFLEFLVVVLSPRGTLPRLPPPWPSVMALALMLSFALAPVCLFAARKVNQKCSTNVIPGRLTDYPGDPAGCLWGCLVFLVTLPLSLPLAIAWGAYTRGFIDVGIAYVDRYGLKVAPVRVPKSLLNMVQPGQVVWFVPRAWNRAPTLWSEQHGHGSAWCLVNPPVHAWFERAAARAAARDHRAGNRRQRAKALGRLRKERGRYQRGLG